ncbi:hypothetical protein CGK29_22355 [Vibrio parahaemolyticus]|nr:hypothetical protein CGK29_22355 [Vibrio parahaemolyticus]TOD75017.1 hypothetical protein CGJ57_19210 [Vibrio parahaemolyticus]TOM85825.1 hypothetical protein CGH69_16250 [Vibrio parahaemolyticus]TOP40953.1 hypothetical protein CGH15_23155 [Vibrio parahaemolyticus]
MCDEGCIIADYIDEKNRNFGEKRNSIFHLINKLARRLRYRAQVPIFVSRRCIFNSEIDTI